MALIFVERSEKLSENTACDVNVGQVKESGKFKESFSSRLGAEVVCAAIKLKRTGNLSSKVASCGYNFLEEYIIVKRTLTTFTNFLELYEYWKCAYVSPIFFKIHSQNVFI